MHAEQVALRPESFLCLALSHFFYSVTVLVCRVRSRKCSFRAQASVSVAPTCSTMCHQQSCTTQRTTAGAKVCCVHIDHLMQAAQVVMVSACGPNSEGVALYLACKFAHLNCSPKSSRVSTSRAALGKAD